MAQYTWTIESTDSATGTMIVAYNYAGNITRYNVCIPNKDADLDAWIDQHAPRGEWGRLTNDETMQVWVGASGAGSVEELQEEEVPNMVGTWNEEYLRAMIYSVLEEIRETEV